MAYNILSPPKQFHLPYHYKANGGATSIGHYFFPYLSRELRATITPTKQVLQQYIIQSKFVSFHKVYIQS